MHSCRYAGQFTKHLQVACLGLRMESLQQVLATFNASLQKTGWGKLYEFQSTPSAG